MSYPEQIYEDVRICQGPDGPGPGFNTFTGRFRKLYFSETTTITNVKTVGDALDSNLETSSGRKLIDGFKGTAIEGLTITQFEIYQADQQNSSTVGTVLAYS